ncbi:MAG: hypothetical protein A4C66_10785 [Nitrospira sp. HN-bin3]|uniref:hypothetical protein n=1 Tax=Nitrospira cf. moscoviensis SBR1015 TaxID=96242 RepID=UPI000A0DBBA5|nr:hypothetical protein [Nitrospira cf. moscoviensis SBR1015]OQW40312.1 MAG: hypothetical protein A4C66_10785 [Nitrospira sp. HN-bin3]
MFDGVFTGGGGSGASGVDTGGGFLGGLKSIGLAVAGAAAAAGIAKLNRYSTPGSRDQVQASIFGVPSVANPYKPLYIVGGFTLATVLIVAVARKWSG